MTDQTTQTAREVREQAAEFLGFVASEWIKADSTGELFEIPSRNCLDSDQRKRYNQLLVEFRQEAELLDRVDDIRGDDGKIITKGKGAALDPNTIDGELVEDHDDRIAEAIFGDRYPNFLKGGGRSADVSLIWWKMNKKLADRLAEDSKSGVGPAVSDPVPGSA
jgi:hypothetical protein